MALMAMVGLLTGHASTASAADKKAKKVPAITYGVYSTRIRSLDPATCGDTTSSVLQGLIFKQLEAMPDGPKRRAICTKAIRMISEDCPVLLLTEPTGYTLHHKWLRNFKPHPLGYGMIKYRRIDTANRPKRKPIEKPKAPEGPDFD